MATFSNASQYSYIGDEPNTLGGIPVAEQNQSYIATFKGVVSTTPEVINNSSFFITYLVDEDGNTNKVSENSDAQKNLNQNFVVGDNVIVRIDQGTLLNPQLAGEHTIGGIGSFVPVLMTQTGSGQNDHLSNVEFLSFNQTVDTNVPNYLGTAFVSGAYTGNIGPSLSTTNGYNYFQPNTFLTSSAPSNLVASWEANGAMTEDNASTGTYVFASNPPSAEFSQLKFRVTTTLLNYNTFTSNFAIAVFRKRGSTLTRLGYSTYTINPGSSTTPYEKSYTLNINLYNYQYDPEDKIYFRIGAPGPAIAEYEGSELETVASYNPTYGVENVYIKTATKQYIDGTQVRVPDLVFEAYFQNPTTIDVSDYSNSQTPYFSVGNDSKDVLTSSLYLSLNYGNVQLTPTASEDFGFSPINSELTIVPGDKIRFGYSQDNVYIVYGITEPRTAADPTYIYLNKPTDNSINLNNFVLYRNLDDGKFITLDVVKNDPQSAEIEFTGLIIPKYATQKLKDNAESIILKLKQDGIIED